MAIDSNVLQEVIDALKQDPEIKNNVYQATVSRIDGEGVVWVNIAGSDTETPTAITSAEVAPGDAVNVEWRNNKLYIGGNYSNPSAGVGRVAIVEELANNAVTDAVRARTAADSAEASATEAKATADAVHDIAVQAQEDAEEASTAAATASTQAQAAKATAEAVHGIAEQAAQDASDAKTAAGTAQTAADSALVGLSTVEDVVGVLNWITAHGTMTSQSGGTFDPDQVYFVMDDSTPGDYHVGSHYYSIVSEPKAADINSYYVLTVDESVQNYVATHIVVDSEGLWIIPDAGLWRILVATGGGTHTYSDAGMYIIWRDGGVDKVHAKFTSGGNILKGSLTVGDQTSAGLNGLAAGTYSTCVSTSYAMGFGVNANGPQSLVIGRNNIPDTETPDAYGYRKYPFIIGNGDKSTYLGTKSNALTVDWSGNLETDGDITDGTGNVLSDKIGEDANGDISITRNITAGGNVEAAGGGVFGDDVSVTGDVTATGDVTDGAGNTLSAVAASVPVIAVETKTLATSVNVSANSTTSSYNIPTKSGYTIAAVTPMVTGSYNGQYFAAITSSNNSIPTSLYFKNTHSSAHTNSFYIRVVYIKD